MHLESIHIYPIKSLQGIEVSAAKVEAVGLRLDRRLMLVDEKGRFISQRELPKLATFRIKVEKSGLLITCKEGESKEEESIFLEENYQTSETVSVQIWDDIVEAGLMSEEVNQWFSRRLGVDCRLVRISPMTKRLISKRFNLGNETVSFADGYPLLLANKSSLDELNKAIALAAGSDDSDESVPVPMARFRPNLVIKGAEAFEEDNWKKIKIGQAIFRITKPCARCIITTIDQATGERPGNEPLKTLSKIRRAETVFPDKFVELGLDKNAVLFGTNLVPETIDVEIRTGDSVEVVE
jgi:uncharacterized protein YcbX